MEHGDEIARPFVEAPILPEDWIVQHRPCVRERRPHFGLGVLMDEDQRSHSPALSLGAKGERLMEPVACPPGQAVMDGDELDAPSRPEM
jgi:hypothetical protein